MTDFMDFGLSHILHRLNQSVKQTVANRHQSILSTVQPEDFKNLSKKYPREYLIPRQA